MQTYSFTTQGICPSGISFALENGKIYDIRFDGGCPGNTAAIAKLLQGTEAKRIVELLKGNDCGGKGTSCADQLAIAVEQALAHQALKTHASK
ncbi:MAG: TIGR03905 family TSCPD domain-containing protein [Elusimicrobiaceae bacterium]|nr:TIGR03905 family TSCPD domain-containing protein [Elusimicrobiaceae bacterium]